MKAEDVKIGAVMSQPTERPTGLTTLLPGGVEVPYVPPTPWWEKDCDCPRCTGPALRMLSFECQGKDWRERLPKEPVLEAVWVLPSCPEPKDEDGYANWCYAAERVHQASGHGHTVRHPIRETAIALWREAVERG